MTFNLSNKDNYVWYIMITVLSDNFARVSATQTECWCKWTVKRTQKQRPMRNKTAKGDANNAINQA